MKYKQIKAIPDKEFSVVGFGCWAASGPSVWNDSTDENSMLAIQKAHDLGVNFFDVAPVYGLGHAESVLGKALKGLDRSSYMIASKCGLVWDESKDVNVNLSKESILKEIDESLERLQTDYIDIYQIHWPDPDTDIVETMEALVEVKESGKVQHVGVSNFSLEELEQARSVMPIGSFQGLYNVLEHNPTHYHKIPLDYKVKDEVLPYCSKNGLAFFPYSPLMQGLLTNGYVGLEKFDKDDVRTANPKLNGESLDTYMEIRTKLLTFANDIDKPLSQVATNWLIEQEAVTSVICGAQTEAHITENVESLCWDLTNDMVTEINTILGPYKDIL